MKDASAGHLSTTRLIASRTLRACATVTQSIAVYIEGLLRTVELRTINDNCWISTEGIDEECGADWRVEVEVSSLVNQMTPLDDEPSFVREALREWLGERLPEVMDSVIWEFIHQWPTAE